MNQETAAHRERMTREEDAEWQRLYAESLKSAIDKIYQSLEPARRRTRAFDKMELRALQKFIRKHYND